MKAELACGRHLSFRMSKALQVWSHVFCRQFDSLPAHVQQAIQEKIDRMGRGLSSYRHARLSGRPEFRLRVGDYRVLYDFDGRNERIELLSVRHRREVYKR